MDHVQVFESTCPHCGRLLTSSINADDGERAPEPGDPSICSRCAGLAEFTEQMKLTIPTRETLNKWQDDPILWRDVQHAIVDVKTQRRL